jgi:hypothetical protein
MRAPVPQKSAKLPGSGFRANKPLITGLLRVKQYGGTVEQLNDALLARTQDWRPRPIVVMCNGACGYPSSPGALQHKQAVHIFADYPSSSSFSPVATRRISLFGTPAQRLL